MNNYLLQQNGSVGVETSQSPKVVLRPNSGVAAVLRSLRRGWKSELLRVCAVILAFGISVSLLGTAYPGLPAWLYDHTDGWLGQKITTQQQSLSTFKDGYSTAGGPRTADRGIPTPATPKR